MALHRVVTSCTAHEWEPCLTPPDGAAPWYRCAKCRAFAYRRRGSRYIREYVCQVMGCRHAAIDRLTGRGPRLSYRWRCAEHADHAKP